MCILIINRLGIYEGEIKGASLMYASVRLTSIRLMSTGHIRLGYRNYIIPVADLRGGHRVHMPISP